jgi:hypothetical protein
MNDPRTIGHEPACPRDEQRLPDGTFAYLLASALAALGEVKITAVQAATDTATLAREDLGDEADDHAN